jgi:hypothetical protein
LHDQNAGDSGYNDTKLLRTFSSKPMNGENIAAGVKISQISIKTRGLINVFNAIVYAANFVLLFFN